MNSFVLSVTRFYDIANLTKVLSKTRRSNPKNNIFKSASDGQSKTNIICPYLSIGFRDSYGLTYSKRSHFIWHNG